jgi:hypothetical protein
LSSARMPWMNQEFGSDKSELVDDGEKEEFSTDDVWIVVRPRSGAHLVRRCDVPGGWLYQVSVDRWRFATDLGTELVVMAWHPPQFVPGGSRNLAVALGVDPGTDWVAMLMKVSENKTRIRDLELGLAEAIDWAKTDDYDGQAIGRLASLLEWCQVRLEYARRTMRFLANRNDSGQNWKIP